MTSISSLKSHLDVLRRAMVVYFDRLHCAGDPDPEDVSAWDALGDSAEAALAEIERQAAVERFDQIRAENPDLGFALYAMEPDGQVTLEVIELDQSTYQFTGKTAAEALHKAFPAEPAEAPEPAAPEPSVFD